LSKLGFSVWYDSAVLQLGDSLREKIDEGLSHCNYGVVILSPNFFAKSWPQKELDGLVTREAASGEKVILPVWHDVDADEVREFSPILAAKLAGRTTAGISHIADQIADVIRSSTTEPPMEKSQIPTEMAMAGVSSSKSLSRYLAAGDVMAARSLLSNVRHNMTAHLKNLIPKVDPRSDENLRNFATEIDPLFADYFGTLLTLADAGSALFGEEVTRLFRIGELRLGPQSGYTVSVELPTWIIWRLQSALGAFLTWRERWDLVRMLLDQSFCDPYGEFRPALALTPGLAGDAVAISTMNDLDRQRYRPLLPLIHLGRTLREVGLIRLAYPDFVGTDEMPFRSIAAFVFLRSLREASESQDLIHRDWINMSGDVRFFTARLSTDRQMFESLAKTFFQVTVSELEENINSWIRRPFGNHGPSSLSYLGIPEVVPLWKPRSVDRDKQQQASEA
jgi:hypothetical protein